MEDRKPIVRTRNDASHNVILESRKKLSVSGVDEIISFNDEEIVLSTAMGVLIVTGNELHINKLSVESGETGINGTIGKIEYVEETPSGKGEGFFAKLFK